MNNLTIDEIIDNLNDILTIYGFDFTSLEVQTLEEALVLLEGLRED